jgi:hypothetical protein
MTKVKAEDKAIAVQELPEGVGQLFYIEAAEQLEVIGGHDPGHLFVCYVQISLLGDYCLAGNSKRHDLQSLQDSIYRHGFKISLLYDPLLPNVSGGLGAVQCGNGRVEDLLYIYANRVNLDVPRGIVVKGEEWYAPVSFGVNDQTREDAIAFSIGENVSNVLGADGFTALDLTRLFDEDQLKAQLGELINFDVAFPVGLEVEDLSVWLGGGPLISSAAGAEETAPPAAGGEYTNKYAILIECESSMHQEEVYGQMIEQGYKCKILTV